MHSLGTQSGTLSITPTALMLIVRHLAHRWLGLKIFRLGLSIFKIFSSVTVTSGLHSLIFMRGMSWHNTLLMTMLLSCFFFLEVGLIYMLINLGG